MYLSFFIVIILESTDGLHYLFNSKYTLGRERMS